MVIIGNISLGYRKYLNGVEIWELGANSVGGVGIKFNFKNDSEKTVKYAKFTFVPYNAVKDVVSCSTRGHSEYTLNYTGPLNPGATARDNYVENCWYNHTISTVELTMIRVEYMDGSEETITGSDIRYEQPPAGGCYVATAVYGSYDCPQVWTLRRFRDGTLAESFWGRAFIRAYYAVSPTLVRWFGDAAWFQRLWRGPLDRLVERLRSEGVEDTPYQDREW